MDDIIVRPPEAGEVFSPRTLFFRDAPVELEIGVGKGGFLLHRAQAHPERDFVGIEWANKFFRFATDRMARWNVGNVRIMRTDASHLVRHQLAEQSIDALHLYHPDPWPKKRHHKRRLIRAEFVAAAARGLTDGALWWIQTDHADYRDWILEVMSDQPWFEAVPFETGRDDDASPSTNFEVKYVLEGRNIYPLAYRRRTR